MKAKGVDPYNLKQQENVLAESRVMVPDCRKRLEAALSDLKGGSDGLFAQKTLEIIDGILSTYKNQGGYDLLGRTKDQIRTTEQVNAALNACTNLKLDALVIIGGVTSNTDAAHLAETFAERNCPTKVDVEESGQKDGPEIDDARSTIANVEQIFQSPDA